MVSVSQIALPGAAAAKSIAKLRHRKIIDQRDRMPSTVEAPPHVNPWIVATAATFLFRRQQLHTHLLAVDVNPYNPRTQIFLKGVEPAMILRGSDPHTAVSQSYGAIWGMVERQASMLAFVDTFRAMAVVSLLMLPLLFIIKRPRRPRGGAAMH
jgi:hypothetical protein